MPPERRKPPAKPPPPSRKRIAKGVARRVGKDLKRAVSATRKAAERARACAKAPAARGVKDPQLAVADVAEDLVRRALRRDVEAAEVFLLETRAGSLRVERNAIQQASEAAEFGIGVRVLARRRLGFAYLTDPSEIGAGVTRAIASARVLPEKRFELPSPARTKPIAGLHDARVERLTMERALDLGGGMISAALAHAGGITLTGGGLGWSVERVAIASSTGLGAEHAGTRFAASLTGVLRDGETTTGFEVGLSRRLDLDLERLGRECADLALRSRQPRAVASGPQTVVFHPTALEGLFEFLFLKAVLGETARAGQSVYAGKRGALVLPREYDVLDDGRARGGLQSAPFDDEGVPTRPAPVVEAGVLTGFLEDQAGAIASGAPPTGSAVRSEPMSGERSFRAPPRAQGRNVVLRGPALPLEDLIAEVREGILVHDALGAHTANAASGDFSVNSSILFRIENGRVTHALKPAMISGNFPRALERLAGIGNDARLLTGSFSPAAYVLPTVRLEGLRVTG